MKRSWLPLALAALSALLASAPAGAQSCSIGGHNETSEGFAPGGWATVNMSPGTVVGAPSGTHLVISEVAPRGAGTGAASDSSEYVEIYNPTTRPVRLDDKFISDDIGYYRVVSGTYPATNSSDWALRFPAGLALDPGRTLVLCVTKAGFAGSGASAAAAQHFLEMRDTNADPTDDMIVMTSGSSFLTTGGSMTNPAAANGEWVVLYCWNGVSDNVCDLDYASWGANSASNPKLDKTGISIDGPDAGAAPTAFNPDMAAAAQTNLGSGTVLAKPGTYQRLGAEVGEIASGGNGCVGRVVPSLITWVPLPPAGGPPMIRFQVRWQNPDEDAASAPINGQMSSQAFGVFQPDFGPIGAFNVPPLPPSSFFDVFFDISVVDLPPPPQKDIPGGPGGVPAIAARHRLPTSVEGCPADTNWAGNVDITWTGPGGQGGQVNKHYADLMTCIGGAPSYIHFRGSDCPVPMPWSVVGVCPGFAVTLVNEDYTPAPNPVPVGWTGWICVAAGPAVPIGASCCFGVVFECAGATSTIDICSTACDCVVRPPTLSSVDWTTSGTTVTFHQLWTNPSATGDSDPVSGDMSSQTLGVFLTDFGPIGHFDVPPIPPSSFFDVFFDVDLSQLPPEPQITMPGGGPPPSNPPCLPNQWHGNVDLIWAGVGGTGNANYHFSEVPVCPGAGCTSVHIETGCASAAGATWSITGLCPGFSATLLNLDNTPAPNPVPPGWIGLICVSAAAATPAGVTCCFSVNFVCDGVPATIDVCAKTCSCGPRRPVLRATDWTRSSNTVRFHMEWGNPDPTGDSDPVAGQMNSQPFGLFLPDFGPIGQFNVPPIPPSSFFDVFIDIDLSQLPQEPPRQLPGGGPGPSSPCPPDTSWAGNVDIMWSGPGGSGQVNRHFTGLLVNPGVGSSHVHALIFCPTPATWSIAGLCPGFTATLLNEDFTPAPNPVPPNWTGWISVAASSGVTPGSACCFTVTFQCDGAPGVIDVCAEACSWSVTGVAPGGRGREFGIHSASPNPTRAGMLIEYALPTAGHARLEVYDLAGHRVRSLFDGRAAAGINTVPWDGLGEHGRDLPPGTYFIRLRSGEQVSRKTVVLVH